jgi:hypothetical protein
LDKLNSESDEHFETVEIVKIQLNELEWLAKGGLNCPNTSFLPNSHRLQQSYSLGIRMGFICFRLTTIYVPVGRLALYCFEKVSRLKLCMQETNESKKNPLISGFLDLFKSLQKV